MIAEGIFSREEMIARPQLADAIRLALERHPRQPDETEYAHRLRVRAYVEAVMGGSAWQEDAAPVKGEAAGIVLTAASSIHPTRVRWILRDRIPLGELSLVVGIPGDGKSTFLLDCGARASRGTLVGDCENTPVAVAVATAEDALAEVAVPRLIAAGADLTRVHFVQLKRDGATGALVLTGNVLAELGRLVVTAGVRLLVLDPLVALLPGGVDTHRDGAVRQVLAPLARLAEDAQLAVAAVVHLNKSQVQEVLARVSGSIGFVGAARSVLLVGRDPEDRDGPTRILAHPKCNVGREATSRRFMIVGHDIEHDGTLIATSRLEWGEDAPDVRARDLIVPESDEGRSALEEAIAFLGNLLATQAAVDNGVDAPTIYRDARKHGITDATLRRAKSRLGVLSRHRGAADGKSGGSWYWHLPSDRARCSTSESEHLAPEAVGNGVATTQCGEAFSMAGKVLKGKMPTVDEHLAPSLAPGLFDDDEAAV